MPVVRYDGLRPASKQASRIASAASAKRNTKPELALRKAIRAQGLRGYRLDVATLPGRPDIVFTKAKVAIFCDGDFWHGRDLDARVARLKAGHNPGYWVEKIRGNVARDRRRNDELSESGWTVLRFWESAIFEDPEALAKLVAAAVQANRSR